MSNPTTRKEVKSDEEYHMLLWFQEAKSNGLIRQWSYEPRSFLLLPERKVTEIVQLKTKQKAIERHVHRKATYTPDYNFAPTDWGVRLLYDTFKIPLLIGNSDDPTVFIDVKGSYQPSNFGSDGRFFSLIQKIMLNQYSYVWIQKVIPKKLFAKTWCPEDLRWMKNRREPTLTVIGKRCLSVEEFVNK